VKESDRLATLPLWALVSFFVVDNIENSLPGLALTFFPHHHKLLCHLSPSPTANLLVPVRQAAGSHTMLKPHAQCEYMLLLLK
jgi:hypothetical protein